MKKVQKYVYVIIPSYIIANEKTILIFYDKNKAKEEKEFLEEKEYHVEMYKIPIKQ